MDCLHEMCLIYFRILKRKVGFKLVSVALKGINKISHLVNLGMMEDLLMLLKRYLNTNYLMPTSVKLHCVMCALKTLSVPSVELQIDASVFIDAFYAILVC